MDVTDDELRLLLQKVARRIRNNRGGENISDSQLSVLFQLDRNGDSTPGQLAEYDHLTPPSMNRTLNGLETAGLIARRPSTDDGRRVIVALTPDGRALAAETRRLRTAWFSQRLAELSADELAALDAAAPVLRKLAES